MQEHLVQTLVCPRSGDDLVLEPLVVSGTGVEYGFLWCEAGRYPIVAGIPIFLAGFDEVSQCLERRRFHEAAAMAAYHSAPSRLARVASGLRGGGPAGRLAERLGAASRRWDARHRAGELFPDGAEEPSGEIVRRIYCQSSARSEDAYLYFRYRFGIPRHLVGLSFVEATPSGGMVLDVGCGSGHLTWSLAQRHPGNVIGLDASFFLLLAARHSLVRDGQFVCADATRMPLRSGRFRAVFSSDVLSYITDKWAAVREIRRVLEPGGTMMLTSVRNRLCDHVFGGEPLSPGGWERLVRELPHRLFADSTVLDRYLNRLGIPGEGAPPAALSGSQTLSILATNGPGDMPAGSEFVEWPHARGDLAVNPLFTVQSSTPDSVVYRRRLPSTTYETDNAAMLQYLPAQFAIPRTVLDDARQGNRPSALEPLIGVVAVLALPAGYVEDAWPASTSVPELS